jgi:hypothetical protein
MQIMAKAVLQRDLVAHRQQSQPQREKATAATGLLASPLPDSEVVPPAAVPDTDIAQLHVAPVAPFPDMSVDLEMVDSPEKGILPLDALPATTALSAAGSSTRTTSAKQSPAASLSDGQAISRPATAPPRKESKIPIPQFPRSAQPSAKPVPTPAMAPPVALASEPPMRTTPPATVSLPANTVTPAPISSSSSKFSSQAIDRGLGFTNMTFTLAAPLNDEQSRMQQSEEVGLTAAELSDHGPNLVGLDSFTDGNTATAESAPTQELTQPDDHADESAGDGDTTNLDELFNLGSATASQMDLDLSLAQDNSNFDELFFSGDGNMDSGDFDAALNFD